MDVRGGDREVSQADVLLLADVRSEIRCAVAVGHADAKEININSKVSGRVVELLVDEGDHVEEGQLIARIDRDMQEPQLNQATTAANLAANADLLKNDQNLAAQRAAQEQAAALQSQLDAVNVNIELDRFQGRRDGDQ
ncbi:MAG: biotin/lipoyl-binding protein [Selenomonadaceae bacterium]|nr:biotin/lipoyl-binding protein [Selenomonadaceae bacterium]